MRRSLHGRISAKDAWDIYFCLKNYPGGVEALAELFKPYVSLGLVREGLEKIASKFLSPEHVGPVLAADFEEIKDLEERHIMQRDAYGQVRHLLDSLGIKEAI